MFNRILKIVAVGDVGLDLYPDLNIIKPGGCALNFAAHSKIENPNAEVAIVSAVGTYSNNRPIFDIIEKYDLKDELIYLSGFSPTQPIRLHTNGEKIFYNYDAGILKDFNLNQSQRNIVGEAHLCYTTLFRGSERLVEQILDIKKAGKVAIDFMNLTDFSKDLNKIKNYLDRIDYCIFGLSASDLSLIQELKNYSQFENKLVLITLAESGVLVFEKGNEIQVPAKAVNLIRDTTGAGDSFAAAFFAHYLNGRTLFDSLNLATSRAATTISHIGAIPE